MLSAAEIPVKFQSDTISINPISRVRDFMRFGAKTSNHSYWIQTRDWNAPISLAVHKGNPQSTDSPHKGPIKWNFKIFVVTSLIKRFNKQSSCGDLRLYGAHVASLEW